MQSGACRSRRRLETQSDGATLNHMPLYDYIAERDGCEYCRQPFEVMRKLSEPELAACPRCGTLIRRMISAPGIATGGAHRLKEGHLEKHGFTQYRKVGKGVYEKTVGKGPKYIQSD